MLGILKYWQYILAGLSVLILSSFISYCVGVSDGKEQENALQLVVGVKSGQKAASQREETENATRKLSDADVDTRLRSRIWMRQKSDR